MANKRRIDKGPPRLIQRLIDLGNYKNQGFNTASIEEEIKRLYQDGPELILAMQFLGNCDRLAFLGRFEDQEAIALAEQTRRADLTYPEALSLRKTLTEKENRIEANARREIEIKRRREFGGSD